MTVIVLTMKELNGGKMKPELGGIANKVTVIGNSGLTDWQIFILGGNDAQ
jgi:hypothetical protein